MTVRARLLVPAVAFLALAAANASAQQIVALTVSPTTFAFPSSDPDLVPSIAAGAITITIRVLANPFGNWRLTVLANGDLVAGTAVIPVSNITWTGTPAPPFQAGTMSKTIAQTVASGTGNVAPDLTGTVLFSLANSWNYSVGIYSQTFAMTLSAP